MEYIGLSEMDVIDADYETLIEELANRGFDVRPLHDFSFTELSNEITRRTQAIESAYEKMMGQGLV